MANLYYLSLWFFDGQQNNKSDDESWDGCNPEYPPPACGHQDKVEGKCSGIAYVDPPAVETQGSRFEILKKSMSNINFLCY